MGSGGSVPQWGQLTRFQQRKHTFCIETLDKFGEIRYRSSTNIEDRDAAQTTQFGMRKVPVSKSFSQSPLLGGYFVLNPKMCNGFGKLASEMNSLNYMCLTKLNRHTLFEGVSLENHFGDSRMK